MSVNNKEIKGEVRDLRLVSAKGFAGSWKRRLDGATFRITSWVCLSASKLGCAHEPHPAFLGSFVGELLAVCGKFLLSIHLMLT